MKDQLLAHWSYTYEEGSPVAMLKVIELARDLAFKRARVRLKKLDYFTARQILQDYKDGKQTFVPMKCLQDKKSKSEKKKERNQPKSKKKPKLRKDFYDSWEWKQVRYQALMKHGAICMLCGADRKTSPIQVDHIKPTSKFPELALVLENLQVLCKCCNMGKSNKHEHDFRS